MKLAVSCIAWDAAEDGQAAELLARLGCEGVELAPARVRPDSRAFWESRGLPIVAMQALLFGHPELRIFADAEARAATRRRLEEVIRLGASTGAHALVFGSPKNRARGALSMAEAMDLAVDFFGALGRIAEAEGTCFCIEPNPPQYGADFITTAREALHLVDAVGSRGFGLHLDTACAQLAGEDFAERARASMHVLRHCHASAPELAAVTVKPAGLEVLDQLDYAGFVSIEQRQTGLAAVERAITALKG